ncbi:MAG: prepilin-type N-terminal cleavage/methylation domain-containing protein [Candidatus Taylorbacteria bacterium]|nr:prepilin-type N-terminal cleavage/methylation domain-containing protein [Candidatus Taylorbacteria bacterium]
MSFNIKPNRYERGFTLVELLVVIAIIGILATMILLQLGIARGRARDTKRVADMSQVRSVLELYYDENSGHYPSQTDLTMLQSGGYLTRLPSDPLVGTNCGNDFSGAAVGAFNCYGYAWDPNSNPIRFQIWTELEYQSGALNSDTDIDSTGWSGAVIDGSDEVDCNTDTPQDCIYDIGVR